MANRNFQPGAKSLEREVIQLYAKFTVGAANAITVNRGKGIASIARTAAGKVTVTLEDVYTNFLFADFLITPASGAANIMTPSLVSEDVAGAKTIVLGFQDVETPAFTDLTDGDVVYVELTLKNSTI
jgi:hypothetical protein